MDRNRFGCLLQDSGFEVKSVGSAERMMPATETLKQLGTNRVVTRDQVVPTAVEIFTLENPFRDAKLSRARHPARARAGN